MSVTLVAVARLSGGRPPVALIVRARVNVVGGVTAQAVGAAQGHALRSLLATLSACEPLDPMEINKVDGASVATQEIG